MAVVLGLLAVVDAFTYLWAIPEVDRSVTTIFGKPGYVLMFFMVLWTLLVLLILLASTRKHMSYPSDNWK